MKTVPHKRRIDLTTMKASLGAVLALSLVLTSSAHGSPMKNPDIKQNPHPRMRYELTLTIEDAPGPFDSISGMVHYKVTNGQCVPLTPISGATLEPEKNVPITFTRVSDGIYKGTLYADLLQDEDYYGLGVCHWGVNTAWVSLRAKGVEFTPAIDAKELVAQKSVPTFFVKGDYFETGKERSAFGTTNRALFQPESRTDVFSMTLRAREDFQ
ncbi:hypothetical protein [Frateuria defendens]|uniref:hypothetical protein n=1 Tax=Frateuria defendens TaxID=2219559 RepID=UPI00066FCB68|nr:hypothetical protein [Frateuria defendens]